MRQGEPVAVTSKHSHLYMAAVTRPTNSNGNIETREDDLLMFPLIREQDL
jgi:hypothetical protein